MKLSAANAHVSATPAHGAASLGKAPGPGLSALETLAAISLAAGELAPLVEEVRTLIVRLTGHHADDARLEVISKALAAERTHAAILQALLGAHLAKGSHAGVALIDRALTSATKRLVLLSREHARLTQGERPVVVAVAHADEVRVDGRT